MFFTPAPKDAQGPAWAGRLCEVLLSKRLLGRVPDLTEWAREFDKLKQSVTPARVDRVLDWYLTHLHEAYVPKAYSAKLFRQKFEQIEQALLTNSQDSKLEVTPRAAATAERLCRDRWPVEVCVAMPEIVQLSLDKYQTFWFTVHAGRSLAKGRESKFLSHVLEGCLHPNFVEDDWMGLQHHRVGRLRHYTGPVRGLAFNPSLELFKNSIWHQWVRDWCNDYASFDVLLGKILGG